MKVTVFSTHKFEKEYLLAANNNKHQLKLVEARLTEATIDLAVGCDAISIFVSDSGSASVLERLHERGVKYLALRSAGFNHVNLERAKALNMQVARVPEYSPYSVGEHAVALMLALNRRLIQSHNRVMEQNFSLDGLVGFDMHGKTVGIIGTGKIGGVVARILYGFGCRLLAVDLVRNEQLVKQYDLTYTDISTLCSQSDIITLHCPLTKETRYIINEETISEMKTGAMLINTGRGGLVKTRAAIDALKSGKIGYFGLDVYEDEEGLFFEDHSEDVLQDDIIARLMIFKNVLVTGHQAFLTDTALKNIAKTTIHNLDCFENGVRSENEVAL